MNSTQVADIVDLMNSEAAPRAERDALAAENARLREAVKLLAACIEDDFDVLDPAYLAATGDVKPPANSEAWPDWVARYGDWENGIVAAARSLVEAPR